MNPKRMFMIVVAMMLTTPGSAGVPERQEIDEVFAAYDNTRSPGCSMAVFRDGKMTYARGYGMANLEYGIANGSGTVFRIGSTSKQFTAMAIALLAEKGALSLDDDIHIFFPEMPDYGEPVTVRLPLYPQEMKLDAEFARRQFAESVEQHFRGHIVAFDHGKKQLRPPR